ncbi:HD domain-containing phosphohydrolase [Petrocella sp. FN5]|uniref:HD domain-containing phosphohydrolase n=1 Tax=Petrocella sp. FN5 TaxID=3032002 RepID=UPI0023D9BD29|nr:HD domain-containing phosphohydrolase [Petrocella sp. FN5]MDF1615909.1 HD domain-containing protein [Petrocella sp. FN5]
MYKTVKYVILLITLVGIVAISIGITIINNKAWDALVEEYIAEKTRQVEYFILEQEQSLLDIIETNAIWTDLLLALHEQDEAWMEENATKYITDSETMNINLIFISNEDQSYIRSYGIDLMDAITKSSAYEATLNDNTSNDLLLWHEGYIVLIKLTPVLDNNGENPEGVYGAGRVMDEAQITKMKSAIGENTISQISITKTLNYHNLVSENYSLISWSKPFRYGNQSLYFNIDANVPIYQLLFINQRNHIFAIIILLVVLVTIIELNILKKIAKNLEVTIESVHKISQGDYNSKLTIHESKYLPEISLLSESINKMSSEIENNIEKIDSKYIQMIEIIANAMEINDSYTHQHNNLVADYALSLAKAIGYEDTEAVEVAGKLHDIGKIAIPYHILNKPGRLTNEEYEIIKKHPEEGYKIIKDTDFDQRIKDGIRYHHEWYDGTGYPLQLKGDDIPMIAQIIAIADVFDALTSDRPYRDGMSKEEAIDILIKGRGSQFNPELVNVFITIKPWLKGQN